MYNVYDPYLNKKKIFNSNLNQIGYVINEDDKHFLVIEKDTHKRASWLKVNCSELKGVDLR